MPLFWLYKRTMTFGKPVIMGLLNQRLKNGKEDPDRIQERFGQPNRSRPENSPLMWVHVASVGEAQSMLHLINLFLDQNKTGSVLVTSITRTSAALLEKRLPHRAFHQYLPVDRPKWVKRFLDYWHPDLVLWAESELWPSILSEIGKRHLPMALINARMSPNSYKNWSRAKNMAQNILSAFTIILTQTDTDKNYYLNLGARSVTTIGNIKFAVRSGAASGAECDGFQIKARLIRLSCGIEFRGQSIKLLHVIIRKNGIPGIHRIGPGAVRQYALSQLFTCPEVKGFHIINSFFQSESGLLSEQLHTLRRKDKIMPRRIQIDPIPSVMLPRISEDRDTQNHMTAGTETGAHLLQNLARILHVFQRVTEDHDIKRFLNVLELALDQLHRPIAHALRKIRVNSHKA